MKKLHGGNVRAATPADLPGFMEIVASLDDPSILISPIDCPDSDCSHTVPASFFKLQFRTPFGLLGYRYATVLDIESQMAGFSIALSLDRLQELGGNKNLPEDLVRARFGDDLSAVMVINLVGVSKSHRRQGIATHLVRCSADDAMAKGYRFIMTQCWKRNKASLRSIEEFGFSLLYEVEHQFSESITDSFLYFDYDCTKMHGNQP